MLESVTVLQEWVTTSGSPEARLASGGVLQQLGRLEEAQAQFSGLDRWDFRRHYRLAALASQQKEHDQALCHLLQGLLLHHPVGDALVSLWADKRPMRAGDYNQVFRLINLLNAPRNRSKNDKSID